MSKNVFVDNREAFNSKNALEKFKLAVKTKTEYDLEELRQKYLKPDYSLALVSSTDTTLNFSVLNC